MVKEEDKKKKIPRIKQRADGEMVDETTGQCPCCRDKLK